MQQDYYMILVLTSQQLFLLQVYSIYLQAG